MAYWIVVVDDDAIELRNAKNLLEGEDLRVSCLRSGADLLKFVTNNTPDLVLLDILMPEMDGFETFHSLRRFEEENGRNTTPVIFLSGDRDRATERRGLKDGASDFIRKPIDKDILLSRIENTIENNKTIALLTEKATLDKLTGFLNKAFGTEKIREICRQDSGALMLFDLDNFKLVNDIYGHDMGDQVLISFADIVKHNTRAEDVISRIGGDEFLGFFSNLSSRTAVKALTDRLNEQILRRCFELMGDEFDIPIGISIGVAFVPEHSRDFSKLFRFVDAAMYRAKQNGKHGVQIHDETEVDENIVSESDLGMDMARLNQILEERSNTEGAMITGKDNFIQIYRLILRFLKRFNRGAEKILLSISVDGGMDNLSEVVSRFVEKLQKMLHSNDVIVQLRSDQILVFVPIVTKEEGEAVADSINKAFGEIGADSASLDLLAEHISFD